MKIESLILSGQQINKEVSGVGHLLLCLFLDVVLVFQKEHKP